MAKINSICCVFNYFQHYRTSIYQLMDKELDCDFYFGDKSFGIPIKEGDVHSLRGFGGYLKNTQGLFHRFKGCHKVVLNRNYKYYIVFGDQYCLSIWWLLICSKILGRKTITWGHGWYRDGMWAQNLLNRIFWRLPSHIMTYGNYAKNHMVEKGINPSKISCIYNSLNYDRQVQLRGNVSGIYTKHFGNNNPVLFFIGRLTPIKKLDLMIEAVRKLKEKGLLVNAVFIGDGPIKQDLVSLVDSYNMNSQVWFYGACYNENEKSELIASADICIAPGNIGLTAMDSLVFGTPAITMDNFNYQMPEAEAIKEGVTGSFFIENDSDDLAKKIKLWLENNKDRDLIRQNCYKEIDEKWNPYNQMNIIKSILAKIN